MNIKYRTLVKFCVFEMFVASIIPFYKIESLIGRFMIVLLGLIPLTILLYKGEHDEHLTQKMRSFCKILLRFFIFIYIGSLIVEVLLL